MRLKNQLISLLFLFSGIIFSQTNSSSLQNDSLFVMEKSSTGALLRSAILPGWGQFYNESYWKIPVVWGFSGWFIYNYIQNDKEYKNFQKIYLVTQNSQDKVLREFYHDQRDLFAIYFFLTYVANLIDAYVDAHLFDFSVKEDFFRKSPQLSIKISF